MVEFTEVPGTVSEVDAIRENAEKHFHQIGGAAVNFAKSRGVSLRSVYVHFDDLEDLQAYLRHPAHEQLGACFRQSLSAALVYDFQVGGVEELRTGRFS